MSDSEKPKHSGGSAERSLQLLQCLTRSSRGVSLAELADRLDIPKATVHRLCARLIDLDFIVRDIDERFYKAGPALQRLAYDTLTHGPLSRLRHMVLSELVHEIGETCNFTALDGASVLYLDRVEAPRLWRIHLDVGAHVPLHCTASGKVFLAFMSSTNRSLLLNQLPLNPQTPHSLTTRRALLASIEQTQERGFALDSEEFIIGLIAIAVPVYDSEGLVRAAIAMHCPKSHVSAAQALEKLPALVSSAERMGELLHE